MVMNSTGKGRETATKMAPTIETRPVLEPRLISEKLGSGITTSVKEVYSTFTCKDAPVENQRPLKVRVIGAGYSGVYLGIRIPQRLRNVDLKIYEKNAGVGGTWWENRYPGCACDIPCKNRALSSSLVQFTYILAH